ncbi:hypothetical protein SSS_03965 [Sarcoptes scabiei]|nr:hypothetical protein SSS_03965 [Sarcoptes scabiei]
MIENEADVDDEAIETNELLEKESKKKGSLVWSDAIQQYRVIPSLPSVLERYYKHSIYQFQNGQDYIVLSHSNRIAILALAPSHELIRMQKRITKIDFNVSKNLNRLDNYVRGKSKKGAQKVEPNSIICWIHCENDIKYGIKACIKAKILEINTKLIEQPSLINEKSLTDGYIAIMLPPFQSNKN